MAKIVKLHCPACGEILEINTLRVEIERHWPKGSPPVAPDLLAKAAETAEKDKRDPDMDGLFKKMEDRQKKSEEKFGEALKRAKEEPVQKPPSEDDYA